jgi:hypothetical protein
MTGRALKLLASSRLSVRRRMVVVALWARGAARKPFSKVLT